MTLRLRDAYREIELYEPGRLPIEVDLSDNTNLFGVAPAVRELLDKLDDATITRYPSVFSKSLKQALAERHGVEPDNIVTGCGSDDIIDSAFRAFCDPGDTVAYPSPTFGVVRTFALMNAAKPESVPMSADFSFATEDLIAAHARVTYVCSPNNPTGSAVPGSQIAELDQKLSGVLLLDEAYSDYAEEDFGSFVATSRRTVSLRTFSKVLGLAGLRIGYAIGPAIVIHEIEKSRGPYKVGGVSEAAAIRVLRAGGEWVTEVVRRTKANRARLAAVLAERSIQALPSHGNFLLICLPDGFTAHGTNAALRSHGVAVRPFGALPHIGECIRVTIGPEAMMDRFVAAFAAVLGGEAA